MYVEAIIYMRAQISKISQHAVDSDYVHWKPLMTGGYFTPDVFLLNFHLLKLNRNTAMHFHFFLCHAQLLDLSPTLACVQRVPKLHEV